MVKITVYDLEKQLIEGKITEEEYKRKKQLLEKLDQLERDLIDRRITEQQYMKEKEAIEAQLLEKPQIISQYANLMKQRKELLNKKEKLRELLLNKEIREETFNKLDGEIDEKIASVDKQLKAMKKEIEERKRFLKEKINKVELELDELHARWRLQELTDTEYREKRQPLEYELNKLKEELEILST